MKEIGLGTWGSQPVTHASTNHARRCLTSQIGRDGVRSTWYGPSRTLGARLAHSSGRRAELGGAQQRRAAAGCARRAQGRAGGPARGRGGAADGPADGSSSSRAGGQRAQRAKPAAGQGRGERASQRASEQGVQGRSPVFFFCLFVCFRPSPSRSSLAGSCPAAPWWRRRRRRTDPARPALPRPSHPVVSRAHCEQRRRREQTGSGRETAAGGDRPRARSRPRRVSGSAARAAAASSTIAAAAASSIEHRDDSGQPAGRARTGDSVAAVGADVGPPATGQPVRGTCRRPRRPVTSARVVVVVLTAAAAAAAGRRHGRASGQASSPPPPPRADGRRSLARAAQPAASCFGPAAERGSETGGPRGAATARGRCETTRRRRAGGTGDDSSAHETTVRATRRRPSVAGARARPRTPWSAAGGGTPNRGHISHARSRAPPGPSASIIGRERAQSKADMH